MVNVGVIGLGFMGLTHLKAYQKVKGARIAAICDAVRLPADGNLGSVAGNIANTEEMRLDMAQVKGYRDYREMLANPEIEMVDICVPTSLHAPMAIDSLAAGKHVLCEKPLARDSTTARRIVEAAGGAKGFFMPAMCLRFWPEWAWLKAAMDDNRFGRLLAASFLRLSEPPGWSQGTYLKGAESGGALLDMHIHDSDFIQFCFGRPKSVFATGQTLLSGAVDHVCTTYQVASGASVTASGSWLMHKGSGFKMAYLANFENATVDYDSTRGADCLRVCERDHEPQTVKLEGHDGYVGEIQHLVDAIASGQAPTVVTAADGLAAVAICEAEEKSVQTGAVVPVAC
ncbi:MAG: Gfo/Idh/MocA family oxidoreductase [Verrucomicrobiales bacterium]|nr:Gfo/Idh/MocA family oxidoreductase [Verrucomicrobiales bacterium]MCP5525396.1 Gfo/Idh/MocA family oxidoreductase [Verrucomicrobiales bacterium]